MVCLAGPTHVIVDGDLVLVVTPRDPHARQLLQFGFGGVGLANFADAIDAVISISEVWVVALNHKLHPTKVLPSPLPFKRG